MIPTYVFDDGRGILGPLTDLRPAFAVRTGALTTLDRLKRAWGFEPAGLLVPPGLATMTQDSYPGARVNPVLAADQPALFVNGRLVLPHEAVPRLEPRSALVEGETGDTIACLCPPSDAAEFIRSGFVTPRGCAQRHVDQRVLMSRPWHVKTFRDAALTLDLRTLAREGGQAQCPGVTRIGKHAITIDADAKVYPGVILDAEHGPIVIADKAVIRPGAIVIGPAYVGSHSTVLERATIRGGTAIGPWCKVNGEISGVIFHGWANKAHDGFLGDSWVGKWVNLGAGTTNSNLLNTYSQVIARATPTSPNERTGEQFLGAVIADHVKTAICTRLMTGVTIHTGAMIASTAPASGSVGAFTWNTDDGRRLYRLDKFLETVRAMMGRRTITPSDAYIARLGELHAAAAKAGALAAS